MQALLKGHCFRTSRLTDQVWLLASSAWNNHSAETTAIIRKRHGMGDLGMSRRIFPAQEV